MHMQVLHAGIPNRVSEIVCHIRRPPQSPITPREHVAVTLGAEGLEVRCDFHQPRLDLLPGVAPAQSVLVLGSAGRLAIHSAVP